MPQAQGKYSAPKPVRGYLFKRVGNRYVPAASPEPGPFWFEFRLLGGGEGNVRRLALGTKDPAEAVVRANALVWKATQFAEEAFLRDRLTPALAQARRDERDAVPRAFEHPRSVTVACASGKRITIPGLWAAVKPRYDARVKSLDVYRQQVAKFARYAAARGLEYAEDVSREFAEDYARWLYGRVTTAPKHIGSLRRVWQLLFPDATSNPWDLGIRLQPKEKDHAMNYRVLTFNEVRRLRQALLRLANGSGCCKSRLRDFKPALFAEMADAVLFSYHYGLRIGSIAAIRQGDFKPARGTWIHRPPKTSRATLGTDYPILPEISSVLSRRLTGGGEAPLFPEFALVHGACEQKFNLAIKAVFKMAKIGDSPLKGRATWHSLRATFITRLTEAGCPVSIVKELAQHAKGEITQRYVHASMESKLKWLSAIQDLGTVDLEAEYPTESELPNPPQ